MAELFLDIDETTTALVQEEPNLILSHKPRLLIRVKLELRIYEVCIPLESFPTITIGRHRDNLLTIADPSVSRYHCDIISSIEGVIVNERASLNSTFVNTSKVSGYRVLAPGDTIRVGNQKVLFLGNQTKIIHREFSPQGFVAIYSQNDIQSQLWRELITTLGWPTIRVLGTIDGGHLPQELMACGQSNILLAIADLACFLQDNDPATMPLSRLWPSQQWPLLATYDPALKNLGYLKNRASEWGFIDLIEALDNELGLTPLISRLEAIPWLSESALTSQIELTNLFCRKP
jgi:hypothetical protein